MKRLRVRFHLVFEGQSVFEDQEFKLPETCSETAQVRILSEELSCWVDNQVESRWEVLGEEMDDD